MEVVAQRGAVSNSETRAMNGVGTVTKQRGCGRAQCKAEPMGVSGELLVYWRSRRHALMSRGWSQLMERGRVLWALSGMSEATWHVAGVVLLFLSLYLGCTGRVNEVWWSC